MSIRNVLARNRDADSLEVIKKLFGTAFASLTTAQQLTTLERECHVSEAECRFRDAQVCHDLLNQIAQTCEIHARRIIQDKIKKLEPLRQKQENNREELVQFTKMWEKAMQEFDAKAEVAINEMKTRHARIQEENEQLLLSQLSVLQPHYSRRVIDLRLELTKLLAQKHFLEADAISKDLMAAEEKEKNKFFLSLTIKFEKKNKELRDAHQLEIKALKKRVFSSKRRNSVSKERRLPNHNQ